MSELGMAGVSVSGAGVAKGTELVDFVHTGYVM
jgi:hypothetical protein